MSVPIIGRESELELVDKLIGKQNSQPILCIEGVGGIGKTRLLQEVYALYHSVPHIKVVGIVDFDDLALVASHNISRKIIEILGNHSIFNEYIDEFLEFRLIQQAGWSTSAIERKASKLQNTFQACLNKFASNNRLVFLFDTTEHIPAGETQAFIVDVLCNLRNSMILFAGRHTLHRDLLNVLKDTNRVSYVKLEQLSELNSEKYLDEKQRILKVVLPPEIRQQLIFLSGGSPILLEMALEWIIQGDSPDWSWLAKTSYDKLIELAPNERQQVQKEFEARLVQRIYQFRGLKGLEPFILVLSIAYPLDIRGISKVMDIPQSRGESLFNYACQQVYIKILPGNFISLHDRMRDLVEEYVWQVEDKRGERRRDIHEHMVTHLRDLISEARHDLNMLSQQAQDEFTGDIKADFIQREILSRQLHSIWEIQLIYHLGQINPQSAYVEFLKSYDAALKDYKLTNCNMLLSKLDEFGFYQYISPSEQYEIDFRYANSLTYYTAKYDKAMGLLNPYITVLPEDHSKQVDVLRLAGNIQIRLGDLKNGIDLFQRAADISERFNLQNKLVETSAALGWAYRHLSYWSRAAEYYSKALRICFASGRRDELFISIHTSLALALGYLQQNQALSLCDQAIEYSRRLGFQRSLGSSHLISGSVFYQFGHLDKALNAFEEALSIFEPVQEEEKMSWAYSWKAVVLWAKSQRIEGKQSEEYMQEAELFFKRSLELGIVSHKPMTLNRLGRVYFARGEFDQAYEVWKEGYEVSRQTSSGLFELCGIRDMANLAVTKRQYDQFEVYSALMKEYEDVWETPHGHTWGGAYLYIGLLALGKESLEEANHYIRRGLEIITDYGTYGVQDLGYYLKILSTSLVSIASPQAVAKLSESLKDYWLQSNNDLFERHPEAMWFFDEWIKE